MQRTYLSSFLTFLPPFFLSLSGSLFHVSTTLIGKDSLVVVGISARIGFEADQVPEFYPDPGIAIELKGV
jgi:hypothetical protein